MQDLSHTKTPPGGWIFVQPQTGWRIQHPVSVTFGQAVDQIIRHRMANKAIVAKHNLSLDSAQVSQELDQFTRLRLGIPNVPSPKQMPRHNPLPPVVGAAADIKRAAQGTGVIMDWLLSGGAPVAQELANRRAAICVECPRNVAGSWFTVAPAELIRSTLSARSDLKLATPHDEKLQSCDVCKCLMRLKVWTPLQFITEHTAPEIIAEFPPHCWIANRDK